MKKLCAVLFALLLVSAVLMAAPAMAAGDNYLENGGQIPDSKAYQGTWQMAYTQILNNHVSPIILYETRDIEYWNGNNHIVSECRPIGLEDLNADGIPELYFLEVGGSDGTRGDFYIYSWSGNSASCKLYVPGITRLDYDDMLGFKIYRSSYGGDTLVIEHYEYEWPWLLQFTRNAFGQYSLLNYLHAEFDNSGEGNDRFYRNGGLIPYNDYDSWQTSIRNGETRTISDYMVANQKTYGFTYTWSSAMAQIGQSGGTTNSGNNNGNNNGGNNGGNSGSSTFGGAYGYTIDKLATRKGPGTQYDGGGTYSVKNQWIKVLAKAWDKRNGIWWVKCEIPYHGEIRVLWTGWKRFDHSTISLDQLPEENW